LGGSATTQKVTDAVCKAIKSGALEK
jgi:hypothetical protein